MKTKSGEQFAVVMKYGQSQINVIFLPMVIFACWDEVRWDCYFEWTLQNMIKWKKNIQPMNEINPWVLINLAKRKNSIITSVGCCIVRVN